jgi:hypothetical protein
MTETLGSPSGFMLIFSRPGTPPLVACGSGGAEKTIIVGAGSLRVSVPGREYTAEELEEMRAAEVVRNFKLSEEAIRANLANLKPPQSWYDEDEDLFGE